ncbi:MAG: hypothetical protein IJH38_02615 [Clostridia bacterium]|nr:hypothetical protein [Clostridia bacterium]
MSAIRKSIPFRLRAAALALCLLLFPGARADDLASDLGGGFQAATPAQEEAPVVMADMTDADLIIGYIDPGYPVYSPLNTNEWNMISVNQLVFESVVDFDENMKPVPMLADNWLQDGVNWTFKLRKGIQFHNGYELTAYDVVRSYQTLLQAGDGNPYYSRLQAIESMEAGTEDIYTLLVTAKNTSYMTLYAMNFPVVQYETLYDELPRGTGPYWYIQYDQDGTLRLEANPLWWKQQPGVKSILLKHYYNAGDAIEAIRTNEIDMLSTKSPKASLSRRLSGLTSMDYPTLTYEMLIPNLGSGKLTEAVEVRQAIMYAIDRSVIASSGYLDMAIQCEVPIVPNSWLYESQSAIYYYSPERALQLMHNQGWYDLTGDGTLNKRVGVMLREPRLTLITYNEDTNNIRENAANLVADYLRAVGFNVTVEVVGKERARQRIKDRDYDLALVGMNFSEVPNLTRLLKTSGSMNMNHYSNEEMDQLLERIPTASDEIVLQKIYSDIQMTLVERLPVLGLLFRTGTVLSARSIGGMGGLRAYDNFNGLEFLN